MQTEPPSTAVKPNWARSLKELLYYSQVLSAPLSASAALEADKPTASSPPAKNSQFLGDLWKNENLEWTYYWQIPLRRIIYYLYNCTPFWYTGIYLWPAAYTEKRSQSWDLDVQSLLLGKCSQKYWAAAHPDMAVMTGSNTSASCSHSSTKVIKTKLFKTRAWH